SACEVIFLDDEQARDKLVNSVDTAYGLAEQVRPQLLEAAERQIALSRAAYQRIYELVESRKAKS
ncbi:MAG: polysaccharide pyruvyl transferase family protein, partial [Planctomycetota bacterium]